MVRGRKRDPTSEPSRALVQQREYRARKAQYQAELEARYNQLEEENEQLRKEVADLRMQVGTSRVTNSEPRIVSYSKFNSSVSHSKHIRLDSCSSRTEKPDERDYKLHNTFHSTVTSSGPFPYH